MYELLIDAAQRAIMGLDSVASKRASDSSTNLIICKWRGDPRLAEVISNIKVHAQKLAVDCTKLALFGPTNPSPEALGSLVGEMLYQIETFTSYYHDAFVNGCSISSQLFVLVTEPVRVMLAQLVELATELKSANFTSAPRVAGAITETATKSICKELPVTNRVAYRRAIMGVVTSTKDIWSEFGAYITKSEALIAKLGGGGGDIENDDDDEEAEEDDEEGSYTVEELRVMRSCIQLLEQTHVIARISIDAVTAVADTYAPLTPPAVDRSGGSTNATVFDSSAVAVALAAQPEPESDEVRTCQLWVSLVVRKLEDVEASAVKFGAELYSPLEDPAATRAHFQSLYSDVDALLQLLTTDARRWREEEEGDSTTGVRPALQDYRHLFSAATNASIDDQRTGLLTLTCAALSISGDI